MAKAFAGVCAAVGLSIMFAPERIDAEATPTPASCAAARTRAERAGLPAADLDRLVMNVSTLDSGLAVAMSDGVRPSWRN